MVTEGGVIRAFPREADWALREIVGRALAPGSFYFSLTGAPALALCEEIWLTALFTLSILDVHTQRCVSGQLCGLGSSTSPFCGPLRVDALYASRHVRVDPSRRNSRVKSSTGTDRAGARSHAHQHCAL